MFGFFSLFLMGAILFPGGLGRQSNMNGFSGQVVNVPTGLWGGQHMGLDVSASGAQIEYDCANGTIDQPMTLDSSGTFDLRGTHIRGHAGPDRQGESERGEPARYTGRVQDQTMTITVILTNSKEDVGTFTLTHGKPPRIRRCL